MKRGRPAQIDSNELFSILLKYKEQIYNEKSGTVLSKYSSLWDVISKEIFDSKGVKKSGGALYSHVSCKKIFVSEKSTENSITENNPNDSTVSKVNESSILENSDVIKIHFSKSEFDSMVVEKAYAQSEHRKYSKTRLYKVFVPGKWQLEITKKLWDECRISCGFLFKRGRVYENAASIQGKCKCGSEISCVISDLKRQVIEVICTLDKSLATETCSKRWCRNPERKEIGQKMAEVGNFASVIQKEIANDVMKFGEDIPAHLYSQKVLRQAKSDYIQGTHVHQIPLTALCILKTGELKNSIHTIGAYPVQIWYSSIQQLHVYLAYCRENEGHVKVALDATGQIVKKITRPDGSISGHIFLYQCTIHSDSNQISVYQMLTEKHDALSIANWLRFWKRHGAPAPEELVCDDGKALLIAGIQVYTQYNTITEYSNACFLRTSIDCYIRIDVAHFLHKYAIFLKSLQPLVKRLYMVAVGQLVLSRSNEEAASLLYSIFTICQCTSIGYLETGDLTRGSKEIEQIKNRVIESRQKDNEKIIHDLTEEHLNESEVQVEKTVRETSPERDDSNKQSSENKYFRWASNINSEAQQMIEKESGDQPNAYFFPSLVTQIINDCKEIPLWSCIMRDHFGYGRIPASSATVESDFNNLKSRILKKRVGLRADEFVKIHLNYVNGTTNLIIAKDKNSNKKHTEKLSETQESEEMCVSDILDEDMQNDLVEEIALAEKFVTNEDLKEQSDCPACANGHEPTGAHKCAICLKNVHIFEQCSTGYQGEEEGYGEKRLCASCSKRNKNDIEEVFSTRKSENWRNLNDDKENEPKSFYMRTNFTENDFETHGAKIEKIILKNATSSTAKSYKIDGINYSLVNTCCFDSITQILLKTIRNVEMRNLLTKWETPYAKFIVKLFESGITSNTYATRARILVNTLPPENLVQRPGLTLVKCEANAAELWRLLTNKTIFITESVKCDQCNKNIKIDIQSLSIELCRIKNLEKAIEEIFKSKSNQCSEYCSGTQTTSLEINGQLLAIDVYSINQAETIKLKEMPTHICVNGRSYKLQGFVSYKPTIAQTRGTYLREINNQDYGHYTSILLKQNWKWTEIDDLICSEKSISSKSATLPHLMIYANMKNELKL